MAILTLTQRQIHNVIWIIFQRISVFPMAWMQSEGQERLSVAAAAISPHKAVPTQLCACTFMLR